MVALIRRRDPTSSIIIGGDFNQGHRATTNLSNLLNLQVAQDQDQILTTHVNSANPLRNNQLDFLLTNLQFVET